MSQQGKRSDYTQKSCLHHCKSELEPINTLDDYSHLRPGMNADCIYSHSRLKLDVSGGFLSSVNGAFVTRECQHTVKKQSGNVTGKH